MNDIVNIKTVTAKKLIAEGDNFKSVCFIFDKGKGIKDHEASGTAILQVLSGSVRLVCENGDRAELKKEDFLSFDASVTHSITANERSKVVVTVVN